MGMGCAAPINKYAAEMLHLKLREHHKRGDRMMIGANDQEFCCKTVAPENDMDT